MKKSLLLVLGLGVLLAGCEESSKQAVRDSSGRFVLAAGMPVKQQKLMQQDLNHLRTMRVSGSSDRITYLKRAMELNTLDANSLFDWLSQRVKFVVGENLRLDGSTLVDLGRFPSLNSVLNPEIQPERFGAGDLKVAMLNLGSALYMAGKQQGILVGLRIPGWDDVVAIRSPRAGIIQVGEGLFDTSMDGNKENLSSEANSLFRSAVFFHESRHSDGRGSSLAFGHIKCPASHQYAGAYACDNNENGPYGIESRLVGIFRESCATCSEKEKISLQFQEADNLSRITCGNQNFSTAALESGDLVLDACRDLKKLAEQYNLPVPEACRQALEKATGAVSGNSACWWDAAPEGQI